MIKKLFVIWLLGLALAGNLQAAESESETRDVEVKMVLLDVEGVNNVKQNFSANLALVMRWRDQSLAHEGPNPISRSLSDIWHPSIQILNQQRIVATLPKMVEIYPDGAVIYRQRFWGDFSQALELKSFPFDKQRLTITLANVGFGTASIRLLPSADSGISKQLSIPDWYVTGWNFDALSLPMEDEGIQVQGMVFSLDVKRDTNYFKFKVIFPLVLILSMIEVLFTAHLATSDQRPAEQSTSDRSPCTLDHAAHLFCFSNRHSLLQNLVLMSKFKLLQELQTECFPQNHGVNSFRQHREQTLTDYIYQ